MSRLQVRIILLHGFGKALGHCRTIVSAFGERVLVRSIVTGHIGEKKDSLVATTDHKSGVALHRDAAFGSLDAQLGAEMDAAIRIVMEPLVLAFLGLGAISNVAFGKESVGLHSGHTARLGASQTNALVQGCIVRLQSNHDDRIGSRRKTLALDATAIGHLVSDICSRLGQIERTGIGYRFAGGLQIGDKQ